MLRSIEVSTMLLFFFYFSSYKWHRLWDIWTKANLFMPLWSGGGNTKVDQPSYVLPLIKHVVLRLHKPASKAYEVLCQQASTTIETPMSNSWLSSIEHVSSFLRFWILRQGTETVFYDNIVIYYNTIFCQRALCK